MTGPAQDRLLGDIRVLDLSDEKGLLCGRMLADLGADVIKVEKPGGDGARRRGPFYRDEPNPEKSLYWFAYNLNKRGITLDIKSAEGQALLKQLARRADVVIESFPVGYLDGLGIGYAALAKENPRLIMAAISPFGQTGPYRDFKATDIVGMAMGGYLFLCGTPESPPVRVSCPQAYLHAASEAAAAVLMALFYRDHSGEGQYIDVSMQASVTMNTLMAVPFWNLSGTILERSGAFRVGLTSGTRQRQIWPCKDGQVNFVIYGGKAGSFRNKALVRWMDSEGMATEHLKQIDFASWDVFDITEEEWERIEVPIGKFFMSHTKDDLLREGAQWRVAVCPIASPAEVVGSEQLRERDFWLEVAHPELGATLKYPGFCLRFTETPCRVWRRPPLIGEHNREIYGDELGLSPEEIARLAREKVI
ncbi:MAG: CoA transferase [Chloroflexota bacterium]